MMDEMSIDTGMDMVLEIGRMAEKIVSCRLRSECIRTGRIPRGPF